MKKLVYAIMALTIAAGMSSCRKSGTDISIKQYDDDQIKSYIQQNNLTGFARDTVGGDTTGIYYKVIQQGKGDPFDYTSLISYVYTMQTFDGGYSLTDTMSNHSTGYLGHLTPNGFQLAMHDVVKKRGAVVRFLIPSRLLYGRSGAGSGTSIIAGNQCIDYTVHVIDNYDAVKKTYTNFNTYDALCIKNYFSTYNLTDYVADTTKYDGTIYTFYYKITNKVDTSSRVVSMSSVVGVQYVLYNLTNTTLESATTTDGTAAATFSFYSTIPGFYAALRHVKAGSTISFILPSGLAYGATSYTVSSSTIPAFSCLRFDLSLVSVSN